MLGWFGARARPRFEVEGASGGAKTRPEEADDSGGGRSDGPGCRDRGVVTSLADLGEGEAAVLERLELPPDVALRLMELGFLPGTVVEASHAAPGGDPKVFRVDGTEIALRLETARHLLARRRP